MNDLNVEKFTTPPQKKYMSIYASIIGLIAALFSIIVIWFLVLPAKINDNNLTNKDIIALIVSTIIICYGMSTVVLVLLGLWRNGHYVDLLDDHMVIYNAWNKPRKIEYDSIKKIRKHKTFRQLLFVLKDNQKVVLSSNMNRYGDLIETIRVRAYNLEEYDYAGLDQDSRLWDNQEFDDDGTRRK